MAKLKTGRPRAVRARRDPAPDPRDALLARIAARVKALRAARGLTARALAEQAGLSLRFVSQLESGAANISIANLDGVARALSTTLAALVAEAPAVDADPAARIAALLAGRPRDEAARCLEAVEQVLGARPRRAIALLGLRGAGKSSLGRAVADRLGLPFVELDERIEAQAGLSLTELFALHGEGYYRRLEAQCLGQLLSDGRPSVIALGGGVVMNEPAFALARSRCTTVWLRASPEDHMNRVLAQGDRRPVADREDAMAELEAILAAREPYYRQAELTVDTSRHGARSLDALLDALARSGWTA